MNRVVMTVLGLGVGVGGVMAGTHLYGQHYVKSQIVEAFERAERSGAVTKYGEIEVSGFIVPNSGVARDVDIYVPSLGMRATIPEMAADPKSMAGGALTFDLPDELAIQLTDENGVPTGQILKVQGSSLEATINSEGQEVYEFGVTAEKTRIEQEVDGTPTGGFFDFTELDAKAKIVADPNAGTVVGDASFDAASMIFTPPPSEGPDQEPGFEAYDMTGSAELNSGGARVAFKAGSAQFTGIPNGEATFERFDLAASIVPKAGQVLDLSGLIGLDDGDEIGRALAASLGTAIANGAAYDFDLKLGSTKVDVKELPDPEVEAVFFSAEDFVYTNDVNPEIIGLGLAAAGLKFEMKGLQALFYDFRKLDVALAANASDDGFNLAPLASMPGPDLFGPIFGDILRQEILEGGDVKLTMSIDGYDTNVDLNDPFIPISSIAGSSGAGETTLTLNAESLDLKSASAQSSIQLAGQVAGRIDAEGGVMELFVPIAASQDPQTAKLKYAIDQIVIDDQLWAMMDPSGALDHTIKGANIEAEMDVIVQASPLENPEAFAGPFPPIQPGAVRITDITLDMLGFKGVATGEMEVVPVPAGVVDVRLTGWAQLLEGLGGTPLAQDPSFTTSLLLARGFIEQFGVPGEGAEETKLEVTFNGPEVSINGQPLTPPGQAPQQ